jgi:hypothetical protein
VGSPAPCLQYTMSTEAQSDLAVQTDAKMAFECLDVHVHSTSQLAKSLFSLEGDLQHKHPYPTILPYRNMCRKRER